MIAPRLHEEDDGGPGWSDARVIVPWEIYRAYGDVRLLERHYPAMVRWLEWQAATAREGVRCFDGCGHWPGFSDWLALDNGWQAVIGATPRDLIGTAYFARSAGLMARIADELGRPDDVVRFTTWRRSAEAAFAREYLAPTGGLRAATQTACLLALAWGLVPEADRAAVFDQLQGLLAERDWHLSTGFVGTPLLCSVLTEYGRADLAQRVFLQTDYPGWLFPVRNGATTMWERWNSWTPEHGFGDAGMNSFNHYAAGAVGRWLIDTIGGLALDEERPAYRHVLIRPQPVAALTWAETEHDSLYGRLQLRWQRDDGSFRLSVRLPPNVTGTVVLPDGSRHTIAAGVHDLTCPPR
jgi:alpha-L-rhamnosidase